MAFIRGHLSWEDLKIPISKTRLKITLLESHSDHPGANELMSVFRLLHLLVWYVFSRGGVVHGSIKTSHYWPIVREIDGVTGGFPAHRVSIVESIWLCHYPAVPEGIRISVANIRHVQRWLRPVFYLRSARDRKWTKKRPCCFNIKVIFPGMGIDKAKKVMRPSYLYHGDPYINQ